LKDIGVALLGAGRIGRVHATSLASLSQARVVAVVDQNLVAAEDARRIAGGEEAVTDADMVFGNPAVDAIVIATPVGTHASLIERAARSGKAIFCEKPVAPDLERTRQALEAVAEARVPFQIGFQRRFDAGYARARAAMDEGAVGDVEMFRAVGRDPALPPASYFAGSGGMLVDLSIHDFDLARFFAGAVVEVQTWGEALVDPTLRDRDQVDTTITLLRFANGALGVVENSWRAVYGYDIRTEVFGSRGKLVIDATPKTPVWHFGEGGVSADHYHFFMDRFKDAYRAELEAFFSAVADGRPPSPGPEDAIESIKISLAATLSLREKRPVKLSELA
jgi:myo-inositol 2-dehydrogenase / D-chiro-inositol 1-dehydrogenase